MGVLSSSPSPLAVNLIVTFTLLLIGSITTVESKTYWKDIEALKEVKNRVDPGSISPGSCLSSWDFTSDPCDTLFSDRFTCGFRCDLTVSGTSRITELGLDQAGYNASLSSISWNLPYLQILDLSNNFFSGPIPDSLSNLTQLHQLGLSGNSLSGPVPVSLGWLSSLEELYLDRNNLEGKVPSSFKWLKSLNRLELQSNRFNGEFPKLSFLKRLYYLDVSDNAISGDIPAGSFPDSVVQISMRNNSLSGRINPESFRNLGYLQVMDLSRNQLNGQVPSLLFEHPSLQQITLSFNKFSSVQYPSGSFLTSGLIAVDLSNNEIDGLLPTFMASLPKLSALSLANNKFRGMIPIEYALKTVMPRPGLGSSQFVRLLLGGNYLFGPVPDPLIRIKPDSATVGLADNCLYSCPMNLFFCEGGAQKSLEQCRNFGPVIP